MSETMEQTGATAAKAPKKEVVRTKVAMADGREVEFAGKQRMKKETVIDGDTATTTFDFINGETLIFQIRRGDDLTMKLAGHGVEQKVGDETSGDESVDDMVLHVQKMLDRLSKGEWGRERSAGDSFAGASLVIKGVALALEWDVPRVKAWLDKKLESDPKLTRQALYKAMRHPDTKSGKIIAKLEAEKQRKEAALDADDVLAEMEAGG